MRSLVCLPELIRVKLRPDQRGVEQAEEHDEHVDPTADARHSHAQQDVPLPLPFSPLLPLPPSGCRADLHR
eukprot:scaffold255172_cov34-Tisochrysis_lutea.AAC.1